MPDTIALAAPPAPPRAHRTAPRRLERLLLPGVLLLALGLRAWAPGRVGLNSDEAVYAGQAASIAGSPQSLPYFPIFRAHPLLFQATLSAVYEVTGVSDVAGRLLSAVIGVITVWLVYLLGRQLYGRRVGLLAALLLAVMPYHVTVTRQILLDGLMVAFSTLGLYCTARYARRQDLLWLYLAAISLGAAALSKETSVILAGAAFCFFALEPRIRLPLVHAAGALALFGATVLFYPASLLLAGATGAGGNFLTYQLFRPANHGLAFYPAVVPAALGWGVVACALLGIWAFFGRRRWRETLLWSWVAIPAIFFEIFPVKGYQYLLPIAAPLAVLAARVVVLAPLPRAWHPHARAARTAIGAVVVASLLVPTMGSLTQADRTTFLAGTGGVPRGRELGQWVSRNVPEGMGIATIGPSMSNLIRWYGGRDSTRLSVSANPLRRNPAYDPIPNPDADIRQGRLNYLVWDAYSAQRSPMFSERLLRNVKRYDGRLVHTESVRTTDASGKRVDVAVIRVYEVRP